jgi:hypothetical protein
LKRHGYNGNLLRKLEVQKSTDIFDPTIEEERIQISPFIRTNKVTLI